MTSYTNARPGAGLLVVDLDHGLRTPRVTVPYLADVARLVCQLDCLRNVLLPYLGTGKTQRQFQILSCKAAEGKVYKTGIGGPMKPISDYENTVK